MKQVFLMTIGGWLGLMSLGVFAECSVATCDASKEAATCEREIAAYNACLDREAQVRWSAAKAGKQSSSGVVDANSRDNDKKTDSRVADKQDAASSAR